jgi:carbamoyltransferase
MNILGLHSSFTSRSHDSSASILINGEVIACVEEERINRKKTSLGYPARSSISQCLQISNLNWNDLDLVVSDGITYPGMKEKLASFLGAHFGETKKIELLQQSDCHLWGAFFHSGFDDSLVFDIEGSGDSVSTKVSRFTRSDNQKVSETILYSGGTDKSIGNLYTLLTQFLGFESIEGEYKVMGMAAYGSPKYDFSDFLKFDANSGEIVGDISRLHSSVPHTTISEVIFNKELLVKTLGLDPRRIGEPLNSAYFDVAASIQKHFESLYIGLIQYWVNKTGVRNVCIAGGCALNALANMKLLSCNLNGLFIMPAASDRGVSLGAAVATSERLGIRTKPPKDMYLGRSWANQEIVSELKSNQINFKLESDRDFAAAEDISKGLIVGNFKGRSEFGPRSLGARSILANPRLSGMKDKLNSRIKFREEFRPFAPAILAGSITNQYDFANLEYMTITVPITEDEKHLFPEAIHSDGSSRVQMVSHDNPVLSNLLNNVGELTGHPSVINTSFNLRGEPIVDSPRDALRTFFSSGMDVLYLEDFRISKL